MAQLISSAEEVAALRDRLQSEGKKLVFTNGCFDLLHAGHVRYLNEARALGDAMVVALNSDASVRALKGPTRPVNNEEDRAEVLLGLRSVDAICVFEGERCTEQIRTIRPHIYAKGGDYTPESLNAEEKAALDQVAAEIRILSLVAGKSTTATLQRLNQPSATGSKKVKLAVLGSGKGSNFGALEQAIREGKLAAEIVLVLSENPSALILEKAKAAGITTAVVNPGTEANKLADSAQKEICDRLRGSGCDLVILAGFMKKLKEPVLSAFKDRILNIHPSLLPDFPGKEAWKQAIKAKVARSGCTVHLVDDGLDTGPILAQSEVPVFPEDKDEDLEARIREAEHLLYPQAIADYAAKLGLVTAQA